MKKIWYGIAITIIAISVATITIINGKEKNNSRS